MINDEESEEILKTSQGKSVSKSAAPTSNQLERPDMDNPQICPTSLMPVNTSPMISPPHSPSELYITDDLAMDVDVDEKETTTSDSVINGMGKDPHLSMMQATKEIKFLSSNVISTVGSNTSFNKKEGRGSLKHRLQIDGKMEDLDDSNKKQHITVLCHGDPPSFLWRVGVGASTLASHKLNQKVNSGTFKLSLTKWHNFKEKITFLDRCASFPDPHGAP